MLNKSSKSSIKIEVAESKTVVFLLLLLLSLLLMALVVTEIVLLTIEELYDVREVHIVIKDDVPVILNKCQSDKEHKMS